MTQTRARRLTAAAVLALTLTAFTLPAAAAPGAWTFGTWELPTFLSWFDELWTGWFDAPAGTADADTSGFTSVYETQDALAEPDGSPQLQTSSPDSDEGYSSPDGSL